MILEGIRVGLEASKAMFAAFQAMDLIEPVRLQVEISPEESHNLHGYFTINEEKLANLSGEQLETAEPRRLPAGRVPRRGVAEQREEADRPQAPQAIAQGVLSRRPWT